MPSHSRHIACGLGLTLGLLFFFNNCGNISMDLGDLGSVSLGSTGSMNVSVAEIDAVMSRLPAAEVDNPRLVEDLVNDRDLAPIYKCGDGVKVMICHFPSDVRQQSTSCADEGSLFMHVDHVREYDLGEGLAEIADYLGPCRIDL